MLDDIEDHETESHLRTHTIRVKFNRAEKRRILDAIKIRFGNKFTTSNAVRTALNLLLHLDLPLLENHDWLSDNTHHRGRRGGNAYTIPLIPKKIKPEYCVYCGRGH